MRVIGLDVGSVTVGIALSDPLKMIASCYVVLRYTDENEVINEIINIIKEKEVDDVCIGMPYHMVNKDESEGCVRSKRFASLIKEKLDIPIHFQDERLSTVEATKSLLTFDVSRKNRKKVVDKVAAAIILQNYLDTKRD